MPQYSYFSAEPECPSKVLGYRLLQPEYGNLKSHFIVDPGK